jgi:peptidoglycan hydrolase-like protein with peptidoglycan-binding domain
MASWFHRELELGCTGADVDLVRRKLNAPAGAGYDADLEARVRGVQRKYGLPVTGRVDSDTADAIGEPARMGLTPEWFRRPLAAGDHGDDVEHLSTMLGLPATTAFSPEIEAAVRRLQSELRMTPTGVVDEAVAVAIGDDVPLFVREV